MGVRVGVITGVDVVVGVREGVGVRVGAATGVGVVVGVSEGVDVGGGVEPEPVAS